MSATDLGDELSRTWAEGDAAGAEPRLVSPLCRAIRSFGTPVPRPVLHAVNTITPDRWAALRLEERRAFASAMAAQRRRAGEDAEALRQEAERLWEEVDRCAKRVPTGTVARDGPGYANAQLAGGKGTDGDDGLTKNT